MGRGVVQAMPRTLYDYLALAAGRPMGPRWAWHIDCVTSEQQD